MRKIKIEKGIEIPKKEHKTKYPFPDMKVGDSFLWPKRYSRQESKNCYCAAANWVNRMKFYDETGKDWKFSVRKVEGNRIRIWRVK